MYFDATQKTPFFTYSTPYLVDVPWRPSTGAILCLAT